MLTKEVKVQYNETYKTLLIETKEDMNKWKCKSGHYGTAGYTATWNVHVPHQNVRDRVSHPVLVLPPVNVNNMQQIMAQILRFMSAVGLCERA